MPHFIIDCSDHNFALKSPEDVIQKVYDAAESTQLFKKGDIKVRINPFKHYTIGNSKNDFIHVFAFIMEGRNKDQKRMLSKGIISKLKIMFPNVTVISMNINDFEKASYCNKFMI